MSPWGCLLMERCRQTFYPSPAGKLVRGDKKKCGKESFHPLRTVGSRPSAVMSLLLYWAAVTSLFHLSVEGRNREIDEGGNRGETRAALSNSRMKGQYKQMAQKSQLWCWELTIPDSISESREVSFTSRPLPVAVFSFSSCMLQSGFFPPSSVPVHSEAGSPRVAHVDKADTCEQQPDNSSRLSANQHDETIKLFFSPAPSLFLLCATNRSDGCLFSQA